MTIDLSSSDANVDYQLFWNYTVPIGGVQVGTGSALSFGNHSLEGVIRLLEQMIWVVKIR